MANHKTKMPKKLRWKLVDGKKVFTFDNIEVGGCARREGLMDVNNQEKPGEESELEEIGSITQPS
jgi:hypothetical protein